MSIAKYAYRWLRFMALDWLPNRPVIWVDANTGEPEPGENWSRSERYHVLRPRFYGWLRSLDCGCSRRLGRMALFNAACVTHLGDLAFDSGEVEADS